jgi:phosphatidylglycerophosphate synthase
MVNKKNIFVIIQLISISRALSGFLFVCIALREELLAFSTILYIYACLSDALDGFLARKFSCSSSPGQILDLFGDKFLTISSVLYAITRDMPIVPLSIIVFREVFLLSIRAISDDMAIIFKPKRILGGITVIPLWITTLLLLQNFHSISFNYIVFQVLYWACGVLSFFNLTYRLIYNWEKIINIFKSYIT